MPTREIRLRYTAIDGDVHHEVTIIELLCEAIVGINMLEIYGDPDFFREGLDGVRYIPPPSCRSSKGVSGCQPVKGIVALINSRQGTCIDLACAFCALLRVQGDEEAKVVVVPNEEVPSSYHTVVQDGAGRVYDPQKN